MVGSSQGVWKKFWPGAVFQFRSNFFWVKISNIPACWKLQSAPQSISTGSARRIFEVFWSDIQNFGIRSSFWLPENQESDSKVLKCCGNVSLKLFLSLWIIIFCSPRLIELFSQVSSCPELWRSVYNFSSGHGCSITPLSSKLPRKTGIFLSNYLIYYFFVHFRSLLYLPGPFLRSFNGF